jgi:hypothetical protein
VPRQLPPLVGRNKSSSSRRQDKYAVDSLSSLGLEEEEAGEGE